MKRAESLVARLVDARNEEVPNEVFDQLKRRTLDVGRKVQQIETTDEGKRNKTIHTCTRTCTFIDHIPGRIRFFDFSLVMTSLANSVKETAEQVEQVRNFARLDGEPRDVDVGLRESAVEEFASKILSDIENELHLAGGDLNPLKS